MDIHLSEEEVAAGAARLACPNYPKENGRSDGLLLYGCASGPPLKQGPASKNICKNKTYK